MQGELVSTNLNISNAEKSLISSKYNNVDFATLTWYRWDGTTLKNNGLDEKMLEQGSYFYINYETGEVLYSEGTIIDDNQTAYYSLTGLKYVL